LVVKLVNILLSIPPLPRFAATARNAFSTFAWSHRIGELDAESFLFALGEAVANAIAHAQSAESIEIQIRMEGDSIVATIRDRGRGFADPPDGRVPLPSIFSEAGRGFAIMQRCTDYVEVETEPGSGTVVTLGRHCRNRQELAAVL
jgi:anti-sigma regulatory factor (Ser/Thr protein kinase)